MIVVDASVLVTALGDDGPDGAHARQRLADERLSAPHLVDLEVVSAWRRLAAIGEMAPERIEAAITDLDELRLRRVGHRHLLQRCWALRENLTVYDAAYVALAEILDVPLLTADATLARSVGARCPIEVIDRPC